MCSVIMTPGIAAKSSVVCSTDVYLTVTHVIFTAEMHKS